MSLPRKRFIECYDKYMETGELNPEILDFMDYEQKLIISELRMYYGRKKSRKARSLNKR